MDLMSIATQEKKKISLLTLPRSDLLDANAAAAANSNKEKKDNCDQQENESPSTKQLVLMQLPKGLAMTDLARGCHFVAPQTQSTSTTKENMGAARQASLVVESKNQSYSVSRLETSNVLVLVPPTTNTSNTIANASQNNANAGVRNGQDEGPAQKKSKVGSSSSNSSSSVTVAVPTSSLLPVPARLLKPGGSGASFLELRRSMLRPGDLLQLLQKHVFDPYNNNNNTMTTKTTANNPYSKNPKKDSVASFGSGYNLGRTIESLARELQCSQGQVQLALPMIQGFPIPNSSSSSSLSSTSNNTLKHYGILSEEALQEAQNGIIATLAESDDFGDYAGKGFQLDEFIPQVMDRFPLNQSYPELEHVIRFALTTLIKTEKDQPPILEVPKTGVIQLDVKKLAVCLAHRLFQSQTRPWEESRFCLRWQSELPGVGSMYQTSLDMLQGVAIPVNASNSPRKSATPVKDSSIVGEKAVQNESADHYWKYFPANKLPRQPELRFPALFDVKDQWTLVELEPYLDDLVQETSLTQAELLLQYTSNSPGLDKDGNAVKVYSFKR